MKRLYFIRHGLSELNLRHAFAGQTDTPLAPEGHEQAKSAGQKAKKQGLSFDTIISSPSQRAHHTAQHIAGAVNYPHEQIELNDLFRERNYGVLEGVSRADISAEYLRDESSVDAVTNAETLQELQDRADRALAYLQTLDAETVLVVAHGAIGRALYRAVNNIPITACDIRYGNAELVRFL